MAFSLHRRTVLKGLGGAAVALPVLECMLGNGGARAQGQAAPRRYAIVFAGQALGGDGWAPNTSRVRGENVQRDGDFVVPSSYGAGYALTSPMRPLAALQDDLSVVSNLRIPYSLNSVEAADVPLGGAFREFHGGGASPLLSGTRSQDGNFRCNGITSDQVLAGLNRGQTRRESLVYRAQPSFYLSGYEFAAREYISYRGPRDGVDAFASPRLAFMDLFGNFVPEDDEGARRHRYTQRSRRSVLDFVLGKRDRLLQKVGSADRQRLERHFDEVRALEQRIAAVPAPATGECRSLDDPGEDPAVGGDNSGAGSEDIRGGTGYSGEAERARVFADLIHMAFVCDLSRVATLQLTAFQSHMNVLDLTTGMGLPVAADLHEVGHNGDVNNKGQIPVSMLLEWHLSSYAYLLDKLKSTPEGDGNVLDHSAILFVPEAGHGRQLNDASSEHATHSVENMILMVAGRAGGLRPGRHIDGMGAHPVQGLVSAMQAAGFEGDTLGEVSGNVAALFG